jgi:competence CoiA-like predicted nuclease
MLVAHLDNLRIEAEQAERSKDYFCPACNALVHVRRRKGYITHFYHLVKANCVSEGEGAGHLLAKRLIADEYRRRGCEASFEWTIQQEREKNFPKAVVSELPARRTDVIVSRQSKDGQLKSYAIEVQDSNISVDEFRGRESDWWSIRVPVLWMLLPGKEVSKMLATMPIEFSVKTCARYAIRPFERELWRLTRQLCFLRIEAVSVYVAQVLPHMLSREHYTAYDANVGDFVEGGGYEYPSERYVDLEISGPVPLSEVRIDASKRLARWQ